MSQSPLKVLQNQGRNWNMASINDRAEQAVAVSHPNTDQVVAASTGGSADDGRGWQTAYSLSSPGMRAALAKAPDMVPVATVHGATLPGEDAHDLNRTVDPCKKTVTTPQFLPQDEPKAMERVQDRDPALYNE